VGSSPTLGAKQKSGLYLYSVSLVDVIDVTVDEERELF